jgi:DNA polymerase I
MSANPNGLENTPLSLVESVEEAGNFLTWLSQKRPHDAICIDIETGELPGHDKNNALSPWHGKIRLAQIGDGQQGWAIPWEEWAGVFYEAMNKYTGTLVFHNIAFESKWFEIGSKWRVPWHRSHDTMLMSQVIDPLSSAALKTLAGRYIDNKSVALQDTLKNAFIDNGWTWGTVPVNFQPYWAYGALDTVLTMRLFEEQFWPRVAPGTGYSIPYELEMNARRIATRMELNGARVDLDYSQKKYDELVNYTQIVKDEVKSRYNGTSITSSAQLVRLFESLGEEITETTASGQKSMTKDTLKFLSINGGTDEVKQLAQAVLNQRKADKLASSYFSNFLEKNIDGIVHPEIRTMGARTGRMSITEPALQTLPSGENTVRKAFIPRTEGWGIISSDLDQVEFRLTASYSQDQKLIDLFNEADATGGDVFTSIMRQVYEDDSLQKADPRRKLIKGVVYGKLYGAGPEKMALTAGVPTAQMKGVVDAFDASYPGIKMLQKSIENAGMQRLRSEGAAYVNTRTGRRLPADDDRVYSLTNYLIQATAAEVFKQNLVKLDQQDLTEYLIVPVHDEIVLEAPKEDAPDVMKVVQECMTTTDGWAVPLTSGVEGPFDSWGDKY